MGAYMCFMADSGSQNRFTQTGRADGVKMIGYNSPMAFDWQLAKKFTSDGDRDIAPFFAGRRTEIEHFDLAVQKAQYRDKPQAVFRIYQGAPGCGKTSLAAHLGETRGRVVDGPSKGLRQSDPDLLFVACDPPDLKDRRALLKKITEYVRTQQGIAQRLAGAATGDVATKVGAGTFTEEVRDLMSRAALDKRTVVLHLDEAHARANPKKHPDVAEMLVNLHVTGLGVPCVMMLTGLGHTFHTIMSIDGLSRISTYALRGMGELSKADCADSTRKMLDELNVAGPSAQRDVDQWADRIADLSKGWPAHLHGAQAALCEGLLQTNGVLRDVDEEAVRERSDAKRHIYYSTRLNSHPALRLSRPLTQRLLVEIANHPPEGRLELDMLCENVIDRAGVGSRLDRHGVAAVDFSRALTDKGLVGEVDGRYAVSVQSMADWAAREIRRPTTRHSQNGNGDGLSR